MSDVQRPRPGGDPSDASVEPGLVSVVIIFLNEENFLQEAIGSVIAQTYTDWEILLVDDGSTDRSTAIARRFAELYPDRIFYLEHPGHENRGMSAARNLGLRHARGEYVAWLDGDDLWLPFKLDHQVRLLKEFADVDFLFGASLFLHDSGDGGLRPQQDFVQYFGVPPNTVVDPPRLLTLLLINEDTHPPNCSFLFRRSLFERVGGFEESFQGMYEDTVFLAKAYLHGRALLTGECSSIYRIHKQSACHVALETGEYHHSAPNPGRAAFLHWLEGYLSSEGVHAPDVERALRRTLWPYRHPALHRAVEVTAEAWMHGQRAARRVLWRAVAAVSRGRVVAKRPGEFLSGG